ncbi:MAG: hypothetical protein D6728_00885 [Cyanobacteria bacterium J055]|nr:MAG: hypothetical protein D6728_00885 [Cyanobacteria bacterium J055]
MHGLKIRQRAEKAGEAGGAGEAGEGGHGDTEIRRRGDSECESAITDYPNPKLRTLNPPRPMTNAVRFVP